MTRDGVMNVASRIFAHSDAEPIGYVSAGLRRMMAVVSPSVIAWSAGLLVCWSGVQAAMHEMSIAKSTSLVGKLFGPSQLPDGCHRRTHRRPHGNCYSFPKAVQAMGHTYLQTVL